MNIASVDQGILQKAIQQTQNVFCYDKYRLEYCIDNHMVYLEMLDNRKIDIESIRYLGQDNNKSIDTFTTNKRKLWIKKNVFETDIVQLFIMQ